MTNYSDSNPNLQLAFSPPSFNLPTLLPSAVPSTSCIQKPRKKRKRSEVFKDDASASTSSLKPVSRPKPPKKPDPGAPEITRPCTECGKKFWSLKALFGHMRCHPEREWRGINPPPNHRKNVSSIKDQLYDSWVSVMSDEDHEVAASLLMLVNGDCPQSLQEIEPASQDPGTSCRFECGVCKKVFGSHQALGGHRASHRNVKGCFAITKSGDASEVEDQAGIVDQNRVGMTPMALGSHKCSICMREFSSGQALGGHMRCHWEKTEESSLTINQIGQKNCPFDLNLPAPVEASSSSSSESSGSSLDLRLGL